MHQHGQVWVKVNSHVDEGIAAIVSLLNAVPPLQTVDSCQGNPGEAYIYFRLDGWRSIGDFLFDCVEPALRFVPESSVAIEAFAGSGPLGKISFKTEDAPEVLSALRHALTAHGHRFASCPNSAEGLG